MLANQRREELLILTKTYPLPSTKYREMTCVAALTRSGEMRRIFPVPFRFLSGEMQFKKWEWISGVVQKAPNDHRPESYRLDVDSVQKLGETLGTSNGWKERLDWAQPYVFDSYEDLEAERQNSQRTLGFIHPTQLLKLDITPDKNPDWTEKERINLTQEGLFDSEEMQNRPMLRKVPFDFHYRYECQWQGRITENRHKITDWEVGALYWNCVRSDGPNWEQPFRARLEAEFSKKDLLFLMGTVHRFPDQWLIIGLVYPPKKAPMSQTQLNFD